MVPATIGVAKAFACHGGADPLAPVSGKPENDLAAIALVGVVEGCTLSIQTLMSGVGPGSLETGVLARWGIHTHIGSWGAGIRLGVADLLRDWSRWRTRDKGGPSNGRG